MAHCKVDIRQIPPPREYNELKTSVFNAPIYIGKFEVFKSNSLQETKAWKATLKSVIKNNRAFSEIKDGEEFQPDSYILDVEISPDYKEEYNYWWTWPAIYPFPGYWPVQIRKAEYTVRIATTISRSNKILFQSKLEQSGQENIYIYEFYRTSEIEEMVENTNLVILERWIKDILSKSFYRDTYILYVYFHSGGA